MFRECFIREENSEENVRKNYDEKKLFYYKY